MTLFQLPPLPYKYGDLEPFLSKEQVKIHYEEHHALYYKKVNALLSEETIKNLSFEDIITQFDKRNQNIYNNVAQAWNHDFFWKCLSPYGGGIPKGDLFIKITETFGGFSTFRDQFISSALNHFGSGWCWLILDKSGRLYIESTMNAEVPLSQRTVPLLTLDIWEHAYLLDYEFRKGKNEKIKYIEDFWTKVNWNFVEQRYYNFVQTNNNL